MPVFLCLSSGATPEDREPIVATTDEKLIRAFLALLARRLSITGPRPVRLRLRRDERSHRLADSVKEAGKP